MLDFWVQNWLGFRVLSCYSGSAKLLALKKAVCGHHQLADQVSFMAWAVEN
jgi:hypothetical protein